MKRCLLEQILSPYRILDLADEKGALCGKILADLGADVIKVERVGGDPARSIGPFYHDIPHPEKSLYWFAYNSSKRGITLNLECPDGQGIFRRLVTTADCIIESFTPGYLDKLGLGYHALSEINPQIIITSITPFGQSGPYRDLKACDLTIQAMSGMLNISGEPDKPCVQFGGAESRQTYLLAGANAAVATLLAILGRQLLGKGQRVDVSIAECMHWGAWGPRQVLYWECEKYSVKRQGQKLDFGGQTQFRHVFPCKDGYVLSELTVGLRGHFTKRLVDWMNEEGMAENLNNIDWSVIDAKKITKAELEHWEGIIGKFFLTHTREELVQEAIKRGFFLFPVNRCHELLNNSQLISNDFFVKIKHGELGTTLVYPGAPYNSTLGSPAVRFRAPLIGENNQDIYKELGISEQELTMLRQRNVI